MFTQIDYKKEQQLCEYRAEDCETLFSSMQLFPRAVNLNSEPVSMKLEAIRSFDKKGKSLSGNTPEFSQNVKTKTILELDLVGYSDIARSLEQLIGVVGVQLLEQQIQSLVNRALKSVNLTRAETFMQTAGDNAILAFDQAEDAHYFAQKVYAINEEQNNKKSVASAHQKYRIGIATGEVMMPNNDLESAYGIVITDAVRLETAAKPGQIVIDQSTYEALPSRLQRLYGSEEKIPGKRSEVFQAYRCDLDMNRCFRNRPNSNLKQFFLLSIINFLM